MYKALLTGLVYWSWLSTAIAQTSPYPFVRLTTAQGLSNNQVNCMTKDRRGFLWIGTMSGLNRYDGYTFRVFRHSLRDSTSIPNNYINRLFTDPVGRLWLKTRTGDAVYDPATERFYRDTKPFIRELGLPANTVINDIREDRRGNYWFQTTAGAYFHRTANRQTTPVKHRRNDSTTPIDDDLTSLREDSRGQVWFVHRNGILEKLDGNSHRVVYRTNALRQKIKAESHDYRLFIDAENDLWLHAGDDAEGVFFVDTKTNILTPIQQGSSPASLNNNLVRDIAQDDKGIIWIGTDHGGINLINKKSFTVQFLRHNPADETSLGQNSIYNFHRDSDGTIWVGTYKQGISYYHPNSTKFLTYQHRVSSPASLPYEDINRFAEDAKGNLWIGTNGGGLIYFDRAKNQFYPQICSPRQPGRTALLSVFSLTTSKLYGSVPTTVDYMPLPTTK